MNKMLILCLALTGAGIVGLFFSDKKRQARTGEWSSMLQWSYLLIMIGIFGVMAQYMSFTAVLLIFTLIGLVIFLVDRNNLRLARKSDPDARHVSCHGIDYLSGFFPIIAVIFLLRTFIAEPFVIPSGSMRPGLIPGDFVLVNKFSYGIRLPILNNVIIPVDDIKRGDVVVFNYPPQPQINYIKRIVGVGGDVVEYRNKILRINGKTVADRPLGQDVFPVDNAGGMTVPVLVFEENLDGRRFPIYQIESADTLDLDAVRNENPACSYDESGFTCTVPTGQYFAMGDNRDNSADSRYWGFVDDRLIVGKAWTVWMNFGDMKRIGNAIR